MEEDVIALGEMTVEARHERKSLKKSKKQGVPIETVNRIMGHTNIKTTQIYAKITKEKICQDMEILSQKLEGLEKQIMERI
jgi:DNA-binding transcriptional MerR regulator